MHFQRRPEFIRIGDKKAGPVLRQTQACCGLSLGFTRGGLYKRHKGKREENKTTENEPY